MNLLGRQDNSIGAGQELKGTQFDTEKLKSDLTQAEAEVQQRAAVPVPGTAIPGGPTFKVLKVASLCLNLLMINMPLTPTTNKMLEITPTKLLRGLHLWACQLKTNSIKELKK